MASLKQFFVALIILSTPLAYAETGPGSSGGGDTVVSEFLATAYWVLGKTELSPEHRQVIWSGLQSAKFKMVKVLVDPRTNEPVPNQRTMIAYGSPGLIQIKERSGEPGAKTWEQMSAGKEPVAHYVVHELIRASGVVDSKTGRSIDDSFEISIDTYHLDRQASFELIQNWFACSIEGSTRKHVLMADSLNRARKIAADRLTLSNWKLGFQKGQIDVTAVHCMNLNGFVDIPKLREAFSHDLFENVEAQGRD